MSWYLFKESPAIKYRGKKVNGFQGKHPLNKICIGPKLIYLGDSTKNQI
jgi:hypothetical protein